MIFQSELIASLQANGENIAIESAEKLISYSQLLAESNKVTNYLLDQKIEPQSFVGILLQNKIELISTIIGVMNAGCVFVPIDVTFPVERLKTMSEDLGLKCFITSEATEDANELFSGTKIYLDEIHKKDAGKVEYPEFDADDSLYVYFTSGSTGKPKGIVGRNKSLLQFVKWEIETFNVNSSSRFSQFISPYFDAFLRDVFVPLMAGGTICLIPQDEDFFSSEKLIPWIDKKRINIIHCVPSLFRTFNVKSLTAQNFESLKYVLLSGEKIIPSELKNWYKIFGDRIQLVNFYGSTETTMIRSYYKIKPEDANQHKISIGSPISDTELMVANKDFVKCNPLIPGDLYVISEYVTKGYLNDPELTKQKFIRLYEGTPDETIAFKTGDKARIMADGKIDLLGREDRQVKLLGIRVELDEIETVLVQSDFAQQAVVVVDTKENDALVAFIIKNDTIPGNFNLDNEAHKHLEDKLPKYMIPSRFIAVSEFPLLSNGKINYQELLNHRIAVEIVPPADEIEEKILEIWKGILGDKPISTVEKFHNIGGNSLSIMKLIGLLYKEYNVRIALSEIFNNLTIKAQAGLIKKAKKDDVLNISKAEEKEGYHLSSSQERIYYNYEVDKLSTTYNIPVAWEITGEVEKDKIESTIKQLIARHESLRTVFKFIDSELLQVVKEEVDFKLAEVNHDSKHVAEAILSVVKPFDLQQAPLFRGTIVTTKDNRKLLVMDVHHIVCDGMSQQQLYADFLALYNGENLQPRDIQFKDYAEWEHEFKTKSEYLAYREFWLKAFEGDVPKLELPVTKNPERSDVKGENYMFSIEKSTINSIVHELKKDDVTTFSGLFSMYFLFLFQLTGQDDIVIGTASSGRFQHELDKVVGMFSKTLPIRSQIDTNMSFKEFAKNLNKHLIDANSKQIYDLTNIVSEINTMKPTSITELFVTMFVFQNFEHAKAKEEFSYLHFDNGSAKFPISLYTSEGQDAHIFRFEYLTEYFTKADIEVLANQLKSLADKISENPEAKIIEIIGGVEETTTLIEEDDIAFNF